MIGLFWSKRAEADLDAITDYIASDNILAAIETRDDIERRLRMLREHPEAGRAGRVAGTREMVLPGTPYIAIYLARPDSVVILRVLHGAQLWP